MIRNAHNRIPLRNIRGHSFKGENLSRANFSYSDIRGSDFSNADLSHANFSHVLAGLPRYWIIISILLSALSGLLVGFVATWNGYFLFSDDRDNFITGCLNLVVLTLFLTVGRTEGFVQAFIILIIGILFIPATLAGFTAVRSQVEDNQAIE